MAEQLFVDTSRLAAAGNALQELDFPVAPAPIVVAGTDSVSAAINETLPLIESPVTEGLPVVKAALTRTGASIAAAAGIYSETDQRLGDHVSRVEFLAAEEQSAGAASAARLAAAEPGKTVDGKAPDQPEDADTPAPKPDFAPTPGSAVPQFGQYAQTAGYATQNVQTAMQSVQGAAGNMPGSSSGATEAERSAADRTQLVDETANPDAEAETPADGAAPGDQASGSIPIQPPTGGRPEPAASRAAL